MKRLGFCGFCITTMLISAIPGITQDIRMHYTGDAVNVDYSMKDGMLNGNYIAYYKNGKKKAKGEFRNNNRVGKWYVYDTSGELKIERNYRNNLDYTLVLADRTEKHLTPILDLPERDTNGCYKWYYLSKEAVIWKKRTYMFLANKNNPILSENNRLFNLLYSEGLKHNVQVFKYIKNSDTSFAQSIDTKLIDTSSFHVIGYLIKADWFEDTTHLEMDCRVLGICPMVIKKSQSLDTTGLFWMYYPQVRKYLANEKLKKTENFPDVQNMDDIFFWRYYNAIICNESSSLEPAVLPVKNSWGVIMEIIDKEHDCWTGNINLH
jgi:hypothetical protein